MRKLEENDEAFLLSSSEIREITDIIGSHKTPTCEKISHWDEHEASFYLKMCTFFGFDFQHLEDGSASEIDSEPAKEMLMEWESEMKDRLWTKIDELIHDERDFVRSQQVPEDYDDFKVQLVLKKIMCLDQVYRTLESQLLSRKEMECLPEVLECDFVMPIRYGPLVTGCYKSGEEPDQIPYHLFLLVKEAAECADDPDGRLKLQIVEEKIRFFCTYLYSHLPDDWEYEPEKARSIVDDYDPERAPKDLMTGFTRYEMLDDIKNDVNTNLTEKDIAHIMGMVHSRKKPTFTNFSWTKISFYCKLCSCLAIDYQTLEDDVCLMN